MRSIKVAITLDDRGGLSFNNRRQSRDSLLVADLCKKSDTGIYVSAYSAPLFEEWKDWIHVVDNPLSDCPDGGLAFVEREHIGKHVNEISELIVYRWNKHYPSDMRLDVDIKASGFKMTAKYEFVGSSHEKITKEIYKR